MSKKPVVLDVEELSGDKYPDLMAAQRLALPALVDYLLSVFHDLIDSGELVVGDRRIIPNPDACIISQSSD